MAGVTPVPGADAIVRRAARMAEISGGSVVKRISRLAARAGIDVHIIAPRETTAS
jgi:hypothetical protein